MAKHPSEVQIQRALRNLLQRGGEDAFVIIEEPESGKFVQFGGAPGLWLDLPCAALDEEEADRAYKVFNELGVEAPCEYHASDSKAGMVRHGASFRLNLGDNVRAATSTALAILRLVYLIPEDTALSIVEN